MKFLFLVVPTLFSLSAGAGGFPTFSAPGASPLEYQQFLKSQPQFISYIQFQREKALSNSTQEQKILQLGDAKNEHLSMALIHLKGLQTEAPLSLTSLRFIRDLTEAALDKKMNSLEARDLKNLLCKTALLLNEGQPAQSCPTAYVDFEKLRKNFPQVEEVLIESMGFSSQHPSHVPIAKDTPYQWRLLSNSYKLIYFYGTYDQLLQQVFRFQSLVEGSCDRFSLQTEEFSIQAPAEVFFSEQCHKISHTAPSAAPWYKKKRTWIYSAGALALGILAYSLKDKKINVAGTALN